MCSTCCSARGGCRTGALKRRFDLDDDYLEDLKAETHQGTAIGS